MESTKRPGRGMARFKRYLPLYLMLLPVIFYYLVFVYAPMGGLVIAFKDYNIYDGILGSPWVELRYFKQFFTSMFAPPVDPEHPCHQPLQSGVRVHSPHHSGADVQ